MCGNWYRRGSCSRDIHCEFAHGIDEVRYIYLFWLLLLCVASVLIFFMQRLLPAATACHYHLILAAHCVRHVLVLLLMVGFFKIDHTKCPVMTLSAFLGSGHITCGHPFVAVAYTHLCSHLLSHSYTIRPHSHVRVTACILCMPDAAQNPHHDAAAHCNAGCAQLCITRSCSPTTRHSSAPGQSVSSHGSASFTTHKQTDGSP